MKRLFFSALVLFLVFFSGCTLEPENTYFIDENVTANYFDVNSAVTGLFAGTGIDLNASIGDVLITTDFNNTNAETKIEGRSISATTTMLIEAIKEQQEQIEDLEARIKALELLQVIK